MKKYVCILFFSLGLLKAQEFPNNLNVDDTTTTFAGTMKLKL